VIYWFKRPDNRPDSQVHLAALVSKEGSLAIKRKKKELIRERKSNAFSENYSKDTTEIPCGFLKEALRGAKRV